MINVENERYSKIRLFEIFIDALRHLVQQDNDLFSWPRGKAAVVHRLASHLHTALRRDLSLHADEANDSYMELPGKLYFDVGAAVNIGQKTFFPDIVLHNRSKENPIRLLAIVCRDNYLSEDEQISLQELQETGNCELALALSFLPQKNYLLIYRADSYKMEYYHFTRDDLSCVILKRREIEGTEDDEQLKLGISLRRRRKKKPSMIPHNNVLENAPEEDAPANEALTVPQEVEQAPQGATLAQKSNSEISDAEKTPSAESAEQ